MTATETDAIQERAERLAEKINDGYPEAWKPEPGDTMVGVFLRLEQGHTSYGPAWIAILGEIGTDRERSIWLLHTALRNHFKRQAPAPGELVAVKYEGEAVGSGGTKYQNWTVRVDRGEKPTDWSKVPGDSPEPEARPAFTDDDDIPF